MGWGLEWISVKNVAHARLRLSFSLLIFLSAFFFLHAFAPLLFFRYAALKKLQRNPAGETLPHGSTPVH